jgi:hypothetical protein
VPEDGLVAHFAQPSLASTFGLTLIHCPLGYVIFTMPPPGPPAYTIFGLSGSATIEPNS